MDVLVTVDQRYDRTPDGSLWTPQQYHYETFTRYLGVFDQVKVLARVREVPAVPADYLRVEGADVRVVPLPHYLGAKQFLQQYFPVRRAVQRALTFQDALIMRAPSITADIAIPWLRGFPYALEVISDPGSTFSQGGVRHPLRPFFRWWFRRSLRQQCAKAAGASYVTRRYLQDLYPCPQFSIAVSDVELDANAFVEQPRPAPDPASTLKLVFVGSLDQLYKAPDILIKAVSLCLQQGLKLCLTMVGDGKHRAEIEQQALQLGLAEQVHFVGKLSGAEKIRAELDRADLFILPSRAEGLPRALLEAMARGLPCIGTTVGGIPELLPPEDLVPPNDSTALAQKITAFATNPGRMAVASQRNLALAQEYRQPILNQQHQRFYQHIAAQTAAWLGS